MRRNGQGGTKSSGNLGFLVVLDVGLELLNPAEGCEMLDFGVQSPALAWAGVDLVIPERLFQGKGGSRRDLAAPSPILLTPTAFNGSRKCREWWVVV